MKYFFITALVILFDQFSKIWIKTNLALSQSLEIFGEYIRFTYIENPGIAFGISISKLFTVVIIMSIVIIIYIIKEIISNKENFSSIGLSLILGGAIGNLIDRICMYFPSLGYNGVVDFIDIGNSSYRWYTFNIADSCVCIGMILYLFFHRYEIINK